MAARGLILGRHFDPIFHCLFFICLYDDAFYFRLNSIDIKYQVWKLGVVFTDNVSPFVSNILELLLLVLFEHAVLTRIKI